MLPRKTFVRSRRSYPAPGLFVAQMVVLALVLAALIWVVTPLLWRTR